MMYRVSLAAVAALLLAGAPSPAPAQSPAPRAAATAGPESAAKANAYVEIQNSLVRFNSPAKDLARYEGANAKLLRPGKLTAYAVPPVDYDGLIGRLAKAVALPGTLPRVDGPAETLLAALNELNPTLKELIRYQRTEEYKNDGGKFAREAHPGFVAKLKAAGAAHDAYAAGLRAHEDARDAARYASLPEGSLARETLGTSLAAKRAVARFEALTPKADPAPFTAALDELYKANGSLQAKLSAAAKADSWCKSFASKVDDMIGGGRRLARELGGRGAASAAKSFIDAYNGAVDNLNRCRPGDAA